jgi:hypothetical protein
MHTLTPYNQIDSSQYSLLRRHTTKKSVVSSDYSQMGMYLFGGFCPENGLMNDLWLITPFSQLKPEIKAKKPKYDYLSLEAVKLEPGGKPPMERAMHSA